MNISLVPIKISEKDVLKEMLYEYEKEMSDGEPGEYKYLDSYWQKPDRFPFFIEVDEKIAGFVLVNSYNLVIDEGKNIAEFYVEKEFRKNGIGREASRQIFNLFPGKWEIRQIIENPKARLYWLKLMTEFTKNNFTEKFVDNDKWHGWIQVFNMNGNKF
ncbi:MAG: GNAT family N-acetyltransferase [Candidatus Shapirobacteria bacterium]